MEDNIFDKIHDVDLKKTMEESYIDYAMSVIAARALPDVRDGLKPVQRRVLYSMIELNNGPDKPHRKCARIVGDTMGKYHPHGDSSIYGALVNMAQDWSTRYPLVDGHGNFGSVDGDGAAAMRYTEARLSKISMKMLADIDKNTVDFSPNFDETEKEPDVLPARFPNLLVNGTTGIAVGMATNIPPHNLREVVKAVVKIIDNRIEEGRETEIEEILDIVKGPDFPTGAMILGTRGIQEAYRTGRGKIRVRAVTEIESMPNGKSRILVSELPYMVNKARLIEKMAELVRDKKIDGITAITDESSREGMRINIELRRDVNANVVLNQLFKHTQLQDTFGVIMLALVNKEPKVLNLLEMLQHYLRHQEDVVTRRTQYELNKAEERAHILEGLRVALDFIDEVIAILRSAKSIPEGKATLMERFGLDDVQANAIVQMRLGQLTGLERQKIEDELAALGIKIADFREILENESRLQELVKEEAMAVRAKFNDERRTEIAAVSGEVDIEDLIPREECIFTMTNFGYVKRQKMDTYKTQNRGGRGVTGMTTRDEDVPTEMFVINSHDYVMFFTNLGRVYRLKCYEVPEGSRTSKGMNIANLLPIASDERVTSIIRVPEFDEESYLVMVTRHGIIKRTGLLAYNTARKGGVIAIDLDEGDELAWVNVTDGNQELLVATKKGMSIRFKETDVRAMGRTARGVKALTLKEDDLVAGMCVLHEGGLVLTVSETGYGRLSPASDYRTQTRGGKGLINYHVDKYGDVASVKAVNLDEDIIMISSDGIIIRIEASSIRECSRPSKGVRVMRVDGVESKVVTIARAPHDEEETSKDIEIEDDGQDEVPDENEGNEETVNQQESSEES